MGRFASAALGQDLADAVALGNLRGTTRPGADAVFSHLDPTVIALIFPEKDRSKEPAAEELEARGQTREP